MSWSPLALRGFERLDLAIRERWTYPVSLDDIQRHVEFRSLDNHDSTVHCICLVLRVSYPSVWQDTESKDQSEGGRQCPKDLAMFAGHRFTLCSGD